MPAESKQVAAQTIKYIVLVAGSLIMVLPFWWMILCSLRDLQGMFRIPPRLYPDMFLWENYVEAWTALPYARAYVNSFIVTIAATLMALLTISLSAYAFAKIDFKFKNIIFVLFLGSMMVPGNVLLVQLYLIIRAVKLYNTLWALIIPGGLFNAYGVFLIRQFFMGIPNDYQEAATIDGAGYLRIWAQVYLPLIRPALVSLGIFLFMGNWNNFMSALIFLKDEDKFTVPLLLSTMRGTWSNRWQILMAAVTIATIPTLLVYIFSQRYIVAGITLTGLKA